MKVAYYLNEGRNKNLYCRITDGSERVSFSLGHTIDPKTWNEKKEEGDIDEPYYFTLKDFKEYLQKRYHELKSTNTPEILDILKNEASSFIDGSGIDGIARKLFDDNNSQDHIPSYDQFIQAFEMHTGLSKGDYVAEPIDNTIHFHTKNYGILEMDTYEGLTARLKWMIDKRSYDEIAMMTNQSIWNEIYIDAGIEKHRFLPEMLREWNRYWSSTYEEIQKSVGKTAHLDEQKARSWREFQVFMECYEGAGDIIDLASDIDNMHLYPIAVITMMQIFDAGSCYVEYCELEFQSGNNDWESIKLGATNEDNHESNDENDESPIFFIRPYEG
jgi:hypothetical protein